MHIVTIWNGGPMYKQHSHNKVGYLLPEGQLAAFTTHQVSGCRLHSWLFLCFGRSPECVFCCREEVEEIRLAIKIIHTTIVPSKV